MAISRMQEPRQMYGLGSLVKKATRAIKKVVKSPVGKAALLAGGAGLLGGVGPFAGLRTTGLGKFLMGTQAGPYSKTGILQKFFLKDPGKGFSLGNLLGKGLTDRGLAAGIGGLSGIAGLMAAQEAEGEDEINIEDIARGEGLDISDIIRRARLNDPEFRFLPGAEFTSTYASGGKVKIKKIQLSDLSPDFREEYLSNVKEGYKGSIEDYIKEYYSEDALDGFKEGGNVSPMGNPAVVEEIDDMREYRIMNPDVEDVADYLTYYQNLKKEENKKPKKKPRTKKAKGGIMDLDGFEMDLRGGGFVPLGAAEKADDVPARLSKNEFVMTADAVRAAGGGSIDKGADKMYKTMKQLESMV